MGLLKKKDRQEAPPPEQGSVLDLLPSTAPASSPTEGDMAKRADGSESGSGSPEKAYTNELRLAVEAVASGTGSAPAASSDKYGLLAELEAQRRRAEPTEPEPSSADPEPALEALEPVPELTDVDAARPGDEPPAAPVSEAVRELAAVAPEPEPAPSTSEPASSGESAAGAGRSATEARARLEAFERSILEKTEAMRQRAAELAQREQELVAKVGGLDALEAETSARHAALAEREQELQAKLAALHAEGERLEEEQAIWGEATRESKNRLAELEKTLDTRHAELEKAEREHRARLGELEAHDAKLAAREGEVTSAKSELVAAEEALAKAQAELERQRSEVDEIMKSLAGRDQEFAARAAELSSGEDALALREREVDASSARLAEIEVGVAERERELARREAEIEAREGALTGEQERLEQERGEWDELMRGAFSRLSELESDLVSSLSVAGMLKRELEGRDVPAPPKDRRGGSARSSEQDEARAFYRSEIEQMSSEAARPIEADGLKESVAEANAADAQANATDWWARQLGRRKKD